MSTLVSVAQFGATTDKKENLETITALVEAAVNAGSSLVVLPENAMFSTPDLTLDTTPFRETLEGEFAQHVAGLARDHGVTIVAGMTEVLDGNTKGSNTIIVVGPDGQRTGLYRKVHLYDAFGYRESDRVQAAEYDALVFSHEGVSYGVMTCYDLRFPEMARALVDAGAEALVVPAAWAVGPAKEDHWTTLLRARAIENTAYVLAAGQSGPHCTGQSAVIDPMGVVIGCAGEAAGVATAAVDPERLQAVRSKNPSLANRRFRIQTQAAAHA